MVSAVRLMAGRTSLLKYGLVVISLFALIRDVTVASQADIDAIGLRKSWLRAGVGTVAIDAVAGCTRVLHFRFLD